MYKPDNTIANKELLSCCGTHFPHKAEYAGKQNPWNDIQNNTLLKLDWNYVIEYV